MAQSEHFLVNPGLNGETFLLPGSSKSVLLFHGFTATTVEVKGLAEFIHTNTKFTVFCPLLPGHGTNPINLAETKYQEWIDSAEIAFNTLASKSDFIFVGGESMGGLLAMVLAALHPEISGLMLYAPALIVPGMTKANIFHNFIFSSPKRNIDSPTAAGCLPWQGYKENPLNAVVELGKLQSLARSKMSEIDVPTIIFQGELDETINPVGSQIINDSISTTQKKLIKLKNSGHCVILEKEHPQVFEESIKFLNHSI